VRRRLRRVGRDAEEGEAVTWNVLDNGTSFVVRHSLHPDVKRLRFVDEFDTMADAEKCVAEKKRLRAERQELERRGQGDLWPT